MFDLVLIRRTGTEPTAVLDIGLLAETLLFYQKVHIILDPSNLDYLLRTLSQDTLLSIISRPGVVCTFKKSIGGVHERKEAIRYYNFMEIAFGDQSGAFSDCEYIKRSVEHQFGKGRRTTNFLRKLLKHVDMRNFDEVSYVSAASDDVRDKSFLRQMVERMLGILVPEYALGDSWRFEPHFTGSFRGPAQPEFVIDTNLNFEELTHAYAQHNPTATISITPSYLLSHILFARESAYLASESLGEMVTDPLSSGILNAKFTELVRKRNAEYNEIDLFEARTLSNFPRIRDAINSRQRTIEEFLIVLDRSEKFKKFIAEQDPDTKLLAAYLAETTKGSWLENLPAKVARFVISVGLGSAVAAISSDVLTGLAVGAGYSAFDLFLLERVTRGWRPNHFIDDAIRPFVAE